MKTVSGKAFCKIAEAKDWKLKRINGSHHIYMKEDRTERLVIPVHRNQDLRVGLQRALMKLVPVTEAELIKLS